MGHVQPRYSFPTLALIFNRRESSTQRRIAKYYNRATDRWPLTLRRDPLTTKYAPSVNLTETKAIYKEACCEVTESSCFIANYRNRYPSGELCSPTRIVAWWLTDSAEMESPDNGAESHSQDSNLRAFSLYQAQHEQNESPHSATASEVPDRLDPLTDARRRRTSTITTTDQGVPSLSDDPTIRAPPAPPALRPYYALISDATKSPTSPETFYPRVRYIFNDDDPDLLTEAFSAGHGAAHGVVDKPHTPSESRAGTVSRNQRFTIPDRALLLDLDITPDGQGYTVSCATSLTDDWAVMSAKVQHLQTGSSCDVPGEEGERTMVLNIQGSSLPTDQLNKTGAPIATKVPLEIDGAATPLQRDEKGTSPVGGYDTLVQSFERRMAFLHSVAHN